MKGKVKKELVFKSTEDNKIDYTDLRLFRFMMVPFQWESIMSFGRLANGYAMVFGIGLVSKVERTKKGYDIVYMNFGQKDRPVIVWEYNTRKQLATVKRNQYATFYGFARKLKFENNTRIVLYARALQGWYVPLAFEVKKKYDDFPIEEDNDSNIEFKEFLDDIMEIKDD